MVNLQERKEEESLPLKKAIETSEKYDASSNSSKKSLTILRNVNLDVTPGQLVGITGGVGSGKSSLLLAILNEVIEWFVNIYTLYFVLIQCFKDFCMITTIDVLVASKRWNDQSWTICNSATAGMDFQVWLLER